MLRNETCQLAFGYLISLEVLRWKMRKSVRFHGPSSATFVLLVSFECGVPVEQQYVPS